MIGRRKEGRKKERIERIRNGRKEGKEEIKEAEK